MQQKTTQVISGRYMELAELGEVIRTMHHAMPSTLKMAHVRLLKISSVQSWGRLQIYEKVQKQDYIEVPYSAIDKEWSKVYALTWRWCQPKPKDPNAIFNPMDPAQKAHFDRMLEEAIEKGAEYMWIDFCCVPQYGRSPMIEIQRSRMFYARALAIGVLPRFKRIEGLMYSVLDRVKTALQKNTHGQNGRKRAAAAMTLEKIFATQEIACYDYFIRVWTLMERMARADRGEKLQDWMSLEVWIGVLLDALVSSTMDRKAALVIWQNLASDNMLEKLESILERLSKQVKLNWTLIEQTMVDDIATLFEAAVEVWESKEQMGGALTTAWLRKYLEEEALEVYDASDPRDIVQSVFQYFVHEDIDERRFAEACNKICQRAGIQEGVTLLTKIKKKEEEIKKRQDALKKKAHEDFLKKENKALFEAAKIQEHCKEATRKEKKPDPQRLKAAVVSGEHLVVLEEVIFGTLELGEDKVDTLLNYACDGLHVEVAALLLATKPARKMPCHGNSIALVAAALVGWQPRVERLLQRGADPTSTAQGGHRISALVAAVSGGHISVVKLLSEQGACVEGEVYSKFGVSFRGPNPLHIAAEKGHTDIVAFLLDKMADINAGDHTALHLVAQKGDERTARLLLERQADVNRGDKNGWTALHNAAKNGHIAMARLLLKHKADPNKGHKVSEEERDTALKNYPKSVIKDCKTPLHCAVENGHKAMAALLLQNGALVDKCDSTNATPLMYAVERGLGEMVNLLLKEKADINLADEDGLTALVHALLSPVWSEGTAEAEKRMDEIIQQLVRHTKLDIDAATKTGKTALMHALIRRDMKVVTWLLEKQPDMSKTDKEGTTALMYAAMHHQPVEVLKALLDREPSINTRDKVGRSALMHAAWKLNMEGVDLLIERGADVNMADETGRTAFMEAAWAGDIEMVTKLLRLGADIKMVTKDGKSALMGAVEAGWAALRYGNHGALTYHEEVVRMLLEKKAGVSEVDKDGTTVLMHAARGGQSAMVRMLLKPDLGVDVDATDHSGRTALMYAARWGHARTIVALLAHGAKYTQDKNGLTPLAYAIQEGHAKAVEELLESVPVEQDGRTDGAGFRHEGIPFSFAQRNPEYARDHESLIAAAYFGHDDIVSILLQAEKISLDVDLVAAPESEYRHEKDWCMTALKWAASKGNAKIVEILIEAGADVNLQNADFHDYGWTALMHAAYSGSHNVVEKLIAAEADVSFEELETGETAYKLALKGGHGDIVDLLRPYIQTEDNESIQLPMFKGIIVLNEAPRGKEWTAHKYYKASEL